DGIRDFHVTGVQTCALPIFAAVCARTAFDRLSAFAEVAQPGRQVVHLLRDDVDDARLALQRPPDADHAAAHDDRAEVLETTRPESGSASGRERVGVAARAGA